MTDAHCALGHLDGGRELGGGLRLDVDAARTALERLPRSAEGADGVLAVVRATMTRALRRVTTERGVDPGDLALVAYGGAGPLHATTLARDLGCPVVIVPPAPGVLSALGLLLAPPRHESSRTVIAGVGDDLEGQWRRLEDDALRALRRQGAGSDVTVTRLADCRYAGQSHELRVTVTGGRAPRDLFHAAHHEAYGYALHDEPVEVVTLRAVAEGPPVLDRPLHAWAQGKPRPAREREIGVPGGRVRARVVDRAGLGAGARVEGPALVEQPDTTTLLLPGDRARVDDARNLVVELP